MDKFTEVDLFLSPNPEQLLNRWTYEQLKSEFGIEDPEQLLNSLWKKYHRIDLATTDLSNPKLFYDFVEQENISLEELNQKFKDYPILALRRLKIQLEGYFPEPKRDSQIQTLIEQIQELELKGQTQDFVIDVGDPTF